MYFAFYGSLRRGMPLYLEFQQHLNYQFSMWLTGYRLYSTGPYPIAVKSDKGKDKILIEVFEIIDQSAIDAISKIEFDAGYFLEEINVNEVKAGIFLHKNSANYPLVNDGDWVKFFRG